MAMITNQALEYHHTSILLPDGIMRLYEALTVERNNNGFIAMPLVRIANLAKCRPDTAVIELQKIDAVRVCCHHDGVIMLEVLKPLRMARRVAV